MTKESDNLSTFSPSRSRFRFSLFTLLVIMTLCCLVAGIWRLSRPYEVMAYLEVKWPTASRGVPSRSEFTEFQQAQLSMFLSKAVFTSALKKRAIAKLDSVIAHSPADQWLRQRIQVSFPNSGDILEVRMDGRGLRSNDDKLILEQLIEEYIAETARYAPSEGQSIRVMQHPRIRNLR